MDAQDDQIAYEQLFDACIDLGGQDFGSQIWLPSADPLSSYDSTSYFNGYEIGYQVQSDFPTFFSDNVFAPAGSEAQYADLLTAPGFEIGQRQLDINWDDTQGAAALLEPDVFLAGNIISGGNEIGPLDQVGYLAASEVDPSFPVSDFRHDSFVTSSDSESGRSQLGDNLPFLQNAAGPAAPDFFPGGTFTDCYDEFGQPHAGANPNKKLSLQRLGTLIDEDAEARQNLAHIKSAKKTMNPAEYQWQYDAARRRYKIKNQRLNREKEKMGLSKRKRSA